MKRRDFSLQLAGGGLGLGLALAGGSALAQGKPVEGTNYVKLSQRAPVAAPAGKIEVVEFFWYGCPHCNAFEPALDAWAKKLPADVAFRRVPVGFTATHVAHQKLFYALEAMNQLEPMHRRVFAAMHVQNQRLVKDDEIFAFVKASGLDEAKFQELFKSFSVQTKATQAKRLSEEYRIDGVPALGVQGRFYTSGALSGSNERSLAVADYLIQQVRAGA